MPQPLHRIEAIASRTRASSPCRATRATTGTSPECPQPHVIRSVPPRRRPSRRPSRLSSRSCRDVASAWPTTDGRSLNSDSRVGFAAGFGCRLSRDRNLLDGIPRDGPKCMDCPGRARHLVPPRRCTDTLSVPATPVNRSAPRSTRELRHRDQAAESAGGGNAGRCNFPGKWKAGTCRTDSTEFPRWNFFRRDFFEKGPGRCSTRTSGSPLLIDGANLYAATKALGFDIDYKLLRQEFMRRGKLLRAFYYTALLENEEYSPDPAARGLASLQRVRHGHETRQGVHRQPGPPQGEGEHGHRAHGSMPWSLRRMSTTSCCFPETAIFGRWWKACSARACGCPSSRRSVRSRR